MGTHMNQPAASTADDSWTSLCALDEIADGDGVQVAIGGRVLAVWRVGDQAHVTDDTCTHGEASLVETGMLDGFSIVCGLHQGEFDIRTGAVVAAPCTKPIVSYPSALKDGRVYARIVDSRALSTPPARNSIASFAPRERPRKSAQVRYRVRNTARKLTGQGQAQPERQRSLDATRVCHAMRWS